jgi:hypothetical protein
VPIHNRSAGSSYRSLVLSHQDIEQFIERLYGQNRPVRRESLGERKRRLSQSPRR